MRLVTFGSLKRLAVTMSGGNGTYLSTSFDHGSPGVSPSKLMPSLSG